MLYISQTVIEYYTLCGPLYSNVNLVKRWISTESESDWYAPCHDLWCGLCTFIMYVTILYQNEITWYISTLRCRWCKLISGLIFQEKYIGWKPVKYELKVSKLNSFDICYSKWKLVWFSFTREIFGWKPIVPNVTKLYARYLLQLMFIWIQQYLVLLTLERLIMVNQSFHWWSSHLPVYTVLLVCICEIYKTNVVRKERKLVYWNKIKN